MPTELRRRNSLERYQPRPSNAHTNDNTHTNDDNDDDSDNLTSQMSNMKLNQQSHKSNRRSINSHLFGNSGHSSRGRGRGRGRGEQKSFEPKTFHKETRQEKEWKMNQRWKADRYDDQSDNEYKNPHKFVFSDEKLENHDRSYRNNNFAPRKKNTETFKPSHKPPDMRILTAHAGSKRYLREMTSRDVLLIYDVFCSPDDLTIYYKLLREIETSGLDQDDIWQLWHGDSHVIADDKLKWKDSCPTFHMVLKKIQEYFQMDIKATRLNWYRSSQEWKPFHHDAAAIKPDKAKTQNLTVGVSFGAERDAAFEHATTKTVISMPQPNGTIYTFGKDVNVIWRHGILQVPPEKYHERGRISIIAWGWAEQTQV